MSKYLLWQEKNPTKGGAETWLDDLGRGLRYRGHSVAWLWSDQIARACDELKPDFVVVGTIHNFIGLQHAETLADLRIPAAWMIHDYWPFCGPRMLMRDQNRSELSCEAVNGTCQNSCGGQHPVPAVISRFYTVTGCQGAAEIMRRNGVRVDGVVELGIDTALFRPGAKTVEPVVYASAAWHAPWKGMRVLAEAVRNAF